MENRNTTFKEIDIDKICSDENLKGLICDLMNEIEWLVKENKELKKEDQRLRTKCH
ncbi:MAG: hypothetical protein AB1630_12630 [bacterium]